MNLRKDNEEQKYQGPRYFYFINYSYFFPSGNGEGMCSVCCTAKITQFETVIKIAEYIKETWGKEDGWKNVVVRNYILLRVEGEEDGTKCGEEKASSENDRQVPEGPQGRESGTNQSGIFI